MGRRSDGPVYRCLLKDSVTHPTCVVAGRDRRNAWLYVHASTPIVLRLHPPVVGFLRNVLAELTQSPVAELAGIYRSLPKDTTMSYPECLVAGRNRQDVWLHVFAATPGAVKLVPAVAAFLSEALAALPATKAQSGLVNGVTTAGRR